MAFLESARGGDDDDVEHEAECDQEEDHGDGEERNIGAAAWETIPNGALRTWHTVGDRGRTLLRIAERCLRIGVGQVLHFQITPSSEFALKQHY